MEEIADVELDEWAANRGNREAFPRLSGPFAKLPGGGDGELRNQIGIILLSYPSYFGRGFPRAISVTITSLEVMALVLV